MPAPHRLASLFRARPDEAAQELRAALTAAGGDVRACAAALGVGEAAVHGWLTAWGLRAWMAEAWPAGERAVRRGRMGQRMRGRKADRP